MACASSGWTTPHQARQVLGLAAGRGPQNDPDVLFLAEAFTKPAMMHMLGKVGFQQSYTYFTWRNEKWEIEEYMKELSTETDSFFRPNFFVNTPDINPMYCSGAARRPSRFARCSEPHCRPCGGLFRFRAVRERRAAGP